VESGDQSKHLLSREVNGIYIKKKPEQRNLFHTSHEAGTRTPIAHWAWIPAWSCKGLKVYLSITLWSQLLYMKFKSKCVNCCQKGIVVGQDGAYHNRLCHRSVTVTTWYIFILNEMHVKVVYDLALWFCSVISFVTRHVPIINGRQG